MRKGSSRESAGKPQVWRKISIPPTQASFVQRARSQLAGPATITDLFQRSQNLFGKGLDEFFSLWVELARNV